MTLFFWQNCVSPHQLPYIKELSKDIRVGEVYLIAPVWELSDRKNMGWEVKKQTEGVEIIISPTEKEIQKIFNDNQQNSIHFFSGIRADKFVFKCFKQSLLYSVKRGIITEPPFDFKIPLFLHRIRFLLCDYKYISKIDFVFGMGDKAVDYYKSWSKKWEVFLFGYSTENLNQFNDSLRTINNIRLVYVGSLIKLKNVILLLKALSRLKDKYQFNLDVLGDGPELKRLVKYSNEKLNGNITFQGKQSMSVIHNKLSDFDILVMPSIRDGWGAVINEGLQKGLYIISSENCGAKALIENSDRGQIFLNKDINSLEASLIYSFDNIEKIRTKRQERITWSERIDGFHMAKYMIDCITSKENIKVVWKD